jgi:hypothetical protein
VLCQSAGHHDTGEATGHPGDRLTSMLILNQPARLHETFFLEAGDKSARPCDSC